MKKAETKKVIKGLDKQIAKVAKTRDDLDEYINEMTGLLENCEEALDCLQRARDALSEMA